MCTYVSTGGAAVYRYRPSKETGIVLSRPMARSYQYFRCTRRPAECERGNRLFLARPPSLSFRAASASASCVFVIPVPCSRQNPNVLPDFNAALERWRARAGDAKTLWASASGRFGKGLGRERLLDACLVSAEAAAVAVAVVIVNDEMVHTQRNASILLLGFSLRDSAKQPKQGRTVFWGEQMTAKRRGAKNRLVDSA